jgi:Domain of unknown function (DUF4864)
MIIRQILWQLIMELSNREKKAIRAVVEAQIQALQKDDADTAFYLASPGIRAMFRNPDNFMTMVKQSYEPVYRPRSVIFESLTTLQDNWTQPVLLLSPQGIPVRALYLMEHQRTGDWRINGCYLVPVDSQFT